MSSLKETKNHGGTPPEDSAFISLAGLYAAFFKVGLFTIGGAYAMIPVAQKALAHIFPLNQITEAFAVAQMLPGVIAANTSAILGHQKRGIFGAAVSVLGVVTPSVAIITLIAMIFSRLEDIELVGRAFAGIRIGVLALLLKSIYELWRASIKRSFGVFVFAAALAVVALKLLSAPLVIAASVFVGFMRWRYADSRL